ncbi:unnamed protein product, partial [Brassica oleracea]
GCFCSYHNDGICLCCFSLYCRILCPSPTMPFNVSVPRFGKNGIKRWRTCCFDEESAALTIADSGGDGGCCCGCDDGGDGGGCGGCGG